jgi:hypothetical protein
MRRCAFLLFFAGCAVGFDIHYTVPEQQVAGDPVAHAAGMVLGNAPINPFALDINLSQQEQANNVSGISTVTLTQMSFTITNSSGCFDFVQDVTISVASTKPGTTLQPAVIATGSNPGCVQTFVLQPTSVNLKPYIDEGAQATTAGHAIPPAQTVTFDGSLTLHAQI